MKTITFLSDVLWTKVVVVPSLRDHLGEFHIVDLYSQFRIDRYIFSLINTVNEFKKKKTQNTIERAAKTAARLYKSYFHRQRVKRLHG